ncbi:unnamed protein product [Mytilus coruscus]|uniref:Uncharacterized protein n=1 Tax=Mytilus coruscus TaxID=42192 RepID=A0A6J8F127_MYTCO|nr:unnamed protein product [Mytilus coruscus]
MVISRRLIDAVNWAVKTNNLCNWKVIRGELDLSPILYHGCIINTEVIFISCGVGILLLLGFGIVCVYAHKKCKRANINRNVNNRIDNVDRRAEISSNVSTNRGSDEEYAEIDEIEMADVIISPLEQRNLTDGDISDDSLADDIKENEESRRNNTNFYQTLQENRLDESRQYSSLTSIHIEQRNRTDGDISGDLSADEIQEDEESMRNNTNYYQSLHRNMLEESRQYSSFTSLHIEEIVDEPI